MKIIFFGSDDFSVVHLEKLIASGHEISACVTQPDQPQGRGLKVEASPVKLSAQQQRIPIHQPSSLKDEDWIHQLKAYNCDLFVVVAYGKILPAQLLEIPSICALNVHGSLLPHYRGAAPINWAIIHGEATTGVSVIKMSPALDSGDIFLQKEIKIENSDTAVILKAKTAWLGADALDEVIHALQENVYTLTVQDNRKATFAPKLTKELGRIIWEKSAKEIYNLVRGLLPWPTAYTYYQGKMLKILETQLVSHSFAEEETPYLPGAVVSLEAEGFVVKTGKGHLLIKRVHPESSRPMDAKSFTVGHRVTRGFRLECPPL